MTIADNIKVWLARTLVKALSIAWVPAWARDAFMTPTFRALTDEGFKGNGAVFACISTLAFSFPEPQLHVYRQGASGLEIVPNHPVEALLRRPNGDMGLAQLLQYSIVYQAIGGNCYWYKRRSQAKRVVQLWPLSDLVLRPIAGADRLVDHYEWDESLGRPEIVPADDVVRFPWLPDPIYPQQGLAPLMAVACEVDTDNEMTRYLFALLRNDAVPRTVVRIAAGAIMDEDKAKRLREQFVDFHGGAKRGGVAILQGTESVERMALNLQELSFEALRRVPEARIAAAFRVPAVLAGLNVGLEQMTYNNVSGMRKFYTEETLVPLWRAYEDQITAQLLPEFGAREDEVVRFDRSTVVALQEDVGAKRTWVDGAVSRGYMTVNEGRAQLGLARVREGDVFLRTMAQIVEPVEAETAKAPRVRGGSGLQGKALRNSQARRNGARIAAAYRQQRAMVAKRLESAVDAWFGGLADRVIHNAGKGWTPENVELKKLPSAEDLLPFSDSEGLGKEIRRFVIELIQLSWATTNLALGVDVAFDLTDPAVVKALALAGTHIKDIHETTLDAIREVLTYGAENGWSVDHLVRGDAEAEVPGLRDLIEETYHNRARAIARSELCVAQNTATADRFGAAGITEVLILDDGEEDDDEPCKEVNNTVQSLEWFRNNPSAHPNCTRCGAPWFGD